MKSFILSICACIGIAGVTLAQISKLDEIKTSNHAIVCLAQSTEGFTATSGYDQTIIIRDSKGEMLKRLKGHNDLIKAMAFSADGKYLVGGGYKKTIFVWSVETGTLAFSLKGHKDVIRSVDVSSKGLIASSADDYIIKLWDLKNGTEFRSLEAHTKEINQVSFSPDGTLLVSAGNDKTIKIWDTNTGAQLKDFSDTDKKSGAITTAVFSPDGKQIATTNTNSKIVIWDALTTNKIKEIECKKGEVISMQYSPDGRFLATGMSTNKFNIWNIETATSIYENDEFSDKIYSLAFNQNGSRLFLCDFTNSLFVWDISPLGIADILANRQKAKEEAERQKVEETRTKGAPVLKAGISDVDINIPSTCTQYKSNRYALIIGNEDYSSSQTGLATESNVDFAVNDAVSFSEYAQKVICIPKENIILLKNAKAVEMHRAIEKISLLTELSNGNAEVFFYFAGHGFPDESTKEPFIMPVDVSGTDLRFAISLKDLYSKLTQFPHQRVTVFLDACFSGGARNQGLLAARAVKITPKNEDIVGNLVVFTASSGQESSLPYTEKKHGMFTYILLKKLQETNGTINYWDLGEYLKTEVGKKSILINNKPQNPQVNISPALSDDWKDWKF